MKLPIKPVISFQENSRATDQPKRITAAAVWMENRKKADHASIDVTFL